MSLGGGKEGFRNRICLPVFFKKSKSSLTMRNHVKGDGQKKYKGTISGDHPRVVVGRRLERREMAKVASGNNPTSRSQGVVPSSNASAVRMCTNFNPKEERNVRPLGIIALHS